MLQDSGPAPLKPGAPKKGMARFQVQSFSCTVNIGAVAGICCGLSPAFGLFVIPVGTLRHWERKNQQMCWAAIA